MKTTKRKTHARVSKIVCTALFYITIGTQLSIAQIRNVSNDVVYTGKASSAETGLPIKNVLVKNLADNKTAFTDMQGVFNLTLNGDGEVTLVFDSPQYIVEEKTFKGSKDKIELKLSQRKISAATARWLTYVESKEAYNTLNFDEDPAWKIKFKQDNLLGDFTPDSSLIRRDPSAVIKVDGLYYTYYTRGVCYADESDKKFFPWDQCELWYATSKDGWIWGEKGIAVPRGEAGAFDDRSVFTPEVLAHKGKYYLVYQCVKAPYVYKVKNTVGMAVADSPEGPWKKLTEPILKPTNNGQYDEDDKRKVIKKGDFDSHKVHDPCLMYYNDKFYLYYKGERMGEEKIFGQREIKWGVAIAEKPEGPYIKSEYNPITNSGHEVCVWPYKGGIALIHTDDGPERHTIQWAADGINFEIMGKIGQTPKAFGIYRTNNPDKSPQEGIRWGLCHAYGGKHWRTGFNYIKRFEIVDE